MRRWLLLGLGVLACLWSSPNGVAQDALGRPVVSSQPLGDSGMIPSDPVPQEFVTVEQFNRLQQQLDELVASGGVVEYEIAPPPISQTEKNTYPDFKVTGFVHLDTAYFDQSDENIATLGDIEDGTGFRRARIAATGNLTERASYIMEFDFAQAQARFVDVWTQIKGTPLGNVRVGRFRQPFGMSELTSVRELPFLERPTSFALSPFRQTGIMLFDTAANEQMTWAVSGFRTLSDNFGNVYGDNGGYGTAERITGLLVDRGDCGIAHVGFDHSFLNPGRNQLQYASQDEVFVGQQPNLGPTGLSVQPLEGVPPFVNTGVFPVDTVNVFNVEGALSFGRGLVQSEYRWSNLDLPTGENVTVEGGYVMARYMLTGEVIPYNRAAGVFGRVKPDHPLDVCRGDWGAWEIAGRVSALDLNPLFGQPGVTGKGRELTSYTIALNWYWWANGKCQFEYINGQLNDLVLGDSDINTFAGRVQFDF
ncbi:OprO/OprP family phosphate-selective porin [Novipirellula sp.]|uniref:OprO/OprP family phosphate-selective porin n=1 Tax=Novipirellula sp. TaxID=2795430 RepID=UPI0035675356